MLRFILRRIGISALILLMGSLLMFLLTINSGDPLEDLRESRDPNRDQQMAARRVNMELNVPWYLRYWNWLFGVGKCITLNCDFGTDRTGVSINSLLGQAASSTLRLVTLATVLAIVIGVSIGILAAIRQYSGFDYAVTFSAFLFFSLPVFWVAVLLKQYGAIRFNNWLAEPSLSLTVVVVVAVLTGWALSSLFGGDARRRIITGAATAVFVLVALLYFDKVNWWRQPALGFPLVVLIAAAAAVLLTVLTTGLRNRRVLYSGLGTVLAGIIGYFVFHGWITDASWPKLFGLLGLSIVIAVVIGWFVGGWEKRIAIWVSVGTAFAFAFTVALDQLLSNWASFLDKEPRPISTIGSEHPNYTAGNFWDSTWNWGTQLILPTVVLTLISLASYSRYTRASMLETTQQDYIRTARSKGLSERVVMTKHALRNALIPLTTIVAFDFAGLIGGAVVTETVFGWKGMGQLFVTGVDHVDPAPVMAFYAVTGTAAVLMNMFADIAYAFLDPRIRR